MKIRIEVDGTRIIAVLDTNATAKDFASLLPLTLTLDDYNGTEKISDLPKKLSTRVPWTAWIPWPGISRTTHRGAIWRYVALDLDRSPRP